MSQEIEANPDSVKVNDFPGCRGTRYGRAGKFGPPGPYLPVIIKVI